jgi:putative iron-dependent peroxidase
VPEPQPIVTPLTAAAMFLVVTVNPGGEAVARGLLADLSGLERAVGFRIPGDLSCVAAIGSAAWNRLIPGPRPVALHPFRELSGPRHRAPATPGDLLFHLRASRMDLCFELATQIMGRLAAAVTVVDEVHGFRYFDERDLLGFVDGTESPSGNAGIKAALVGEEDPEFTGGSYVIVQKYLHDMRAWNALAVEEQERVIGRTKLADIELPGDVQPANSHVALNQVTGPDGQERQIIRANMPFGDVGRGEFGTYYIAYAADPAVTEEMLGNMFIGRPPGNTDRILDFSTAVTGCLFFAPAADFLDDLPALPGEAAQGAGTAGASPGNGSPGNGSLGIGSLGRRRA